MIPIDKGVAVPAKTSRNATYPFADMEVGDSFYVASVKENHQRILGSVATCVRHYVTRRAPQKRFTVRQIDSGIRCWRLADAQDS